MKKSYYIIIASLFSISAGFSQVNVSGTVLSNNSETLPAATIFFTIRDSLVAGTTTNDQGAFSLRMNAGSYTMHVSYLGYERYSNEIQILSTNLHLPPIVLKAESQELGEVTISGERRTFEIVNNREIFNIPNSIKRSSSDVYQILTHIPSLQVNLIEKTVSLTGSENHIIMVNNIPRDNQFLQTLRPEDIERIEIIKNTGARFGARNVDGIINIVVRSKSVGQSGNAGGHLHPGMMFGYADASYVYVAEKMSVSVMGQNFFFDEKDRKFSNIREITHGDRTVRTERSTDQIVFKMRNPFLSTSIDYTISPKFFATLDLRYFHSPQQMKRPLTGSIYVNDVKESDFNSLTTDDTKADRLWGTLYMENRFDENRTLSLDANFSQPKSQLNNLYEEWSNGEETIRIDRSIRNLQQDFDIQINYRHKHRRQIFEMGYRFFQRVNDFDEQLNDIINQMRYDEWRNYLYISAMGSITDRVTYQVGLGFDIVKTDINKELTNRFFEPAPNFRLGYRINSEQNINVDYRRNRRNPAFSNMNPFPFYTDSNFVTYGNPHLKPFYMNVLRLNYNLTKSRLSATPYVEYQYANNFIVRWEFLDDTNVRNVTFANTGNYSAISTGFNFSVNPLSWWRISGSASMSYRMYEDENENQFNKKFWVPFLGAESSANYKKLGISLYYYPAFQTPTLTGFEKGYSQSALSANYNLNQTFSLFGGFRYLFPMTYRAETYADNYREITNDRMLERSWQLLLGGRINLQQGKQRAWRQRLVRQFNDDMNIDVQRF
jgi:hypothetical protein